MNIRKDKMNHKGRSTKLGDKPAIRCVDRMATGELLADRRARAQPHSARAGRDAGAAAIHRFPWQ